MLIGHARVSTMDQTPCFKWMRDAISAAKGSSSTKPLAPIATVPTKAALDDPREGIRGRLEALAHPVGLSRKRSKQSPTLLSAASPSSAVYSNIDTSTPEGRLFFHMTAALTSSNAS